MSYILLVETNVGLADVLEVYFHMEGYDCCRATETKTILDYIKAKGQPHAVVLDYSLAWGIEAELLINLLKVIGVTNIILMTSYVDTRQIKEKFNIHKILRKPFSLEELSSVIH